MALQLRTHAFTVDDFHHMVEAGILRHGDRVELLDGDFIDMPPAGSRHAACVAGFADHLGAQVVGKAALRLDTALRTGPSSEVRPAVMVLRMQAANGKEDEAAPYPTLEDVLLLVEVTEEFDESIRVKKLPHYANIGVPEVWLIDLKHERVERYSKPFKGRFQSIDPFHRGMHLQPQLLADVRLAVGDLLP